jgi:mono/diheme cytochrome c family protein
MPSFADLPPEEIQMLARQVREFYQLGMRARLLGRDLPASEADDDDVRTRAWESLVTPGEVLPVPETGRANPAALTRGRALYVQVGCHRCHGDDGRGAEDLPLFDDGGQPTVPRNLVQDPMKGGPEPDALYRRIRLGMPGTPHPAAASLSESDAIALVHYCRSLATDPPAASTNHERALRAMRRGAQ